MPSVSNFPFLTDKEFVSACEELQDGSDYVFLQEPGAILRFTRTFPLSNGNTSLESDVERTARDEDDCEDDETENTDEDALMKRTTEPSLVVMYDIVLSASYRVPVVYLQPRSSLDASRPPDIRQLYDAVVPDSQRSAIEGTGVYGALSMTEHPVTGLPAYFIHPCRTADALRASSAGQQVSPKDYLMLWFGIIGTNVGLTVPLRTALRLHGAG